jgi:aryl-alcohol dehydrogenase-like predicted oxidoreductase
MQKRQLGLSGLEVSAIGLGCMAMSEFYGARDETEAIATIHRAIELGVDLIDTADVYGLGRNEELVGRAIRRRRDRVVLSSKFGHVRGADGRFLGVNGRPGYAKASCEASLRRLKVETIDLYYLHRVDPDTPIEDTVGAMAELVWQGKVRYLGLSEAAPASLRRAHAVHPIAALQTEYSLLSREPEGDIFRSVRTFGIGFIAYSPLGRGLLSGKLKDLGKLGADDWRPRASRFQEPHFQKNLKLVAELETIAARKGLTPAQVALAFVLAQHPHIVVLPGMERREDLEENVAAVDVTLSKEELAELDRAFPVGAAFGLRYPEAHMPTLNR